MKHIAPKDKLEIVIKICKEYSITPKELANGTKIKVATIKNILSGKTKTPRLHNINLLLDYINHRFSANPENECAHVNICNAPFCTLQEKVKIIAAQDETLELLRQKIIFLENK